jgi:hypothetical protein
VVTHLLRPLLVIVALGSSGAAQAVPVVLDFGDGDLIQPPTFAPPYSEDGFRFSTINQVQPGVEQDHFDIHDLANYPNAGEREAAIHTGNDGDEVIVDFFGAPFGLISLDIELFDEPAEGVWEIEASNGAMLTFTGVGTVNFDASWSNITAFTLRSTAVPDLNDFSGQLYFDNITLETEPRVPEPASLALLAIGLAGVGLAQRRAG